MFGGAVLETGLKVGYMGFDFSSHLGPPVMQGTRCHHNVEVFSSLVYAADDFLSESFWWVNPVNSIDPAFAYDFGFLHYAYHVLFTYHPVCLRIRW